MKTFHPLQRPCNLRTFTALLVACVLLVTPVVPAATGTALASFNPAFAPATTIVSATKADSWDDSATPDGKAEPGQTLTYDVNVSNTGAADATGVTFTDTIDPNTTLVPGSLRVSPLAFADAYSAALNTALSVPAPGVLANDTGTPAPAAQPISSGPTSGGGTVTLNADGSFNYTPATGFQGADTFTYTAANGLTPNDSATVTINVDDGPVVTATTPANGATGVAQNTNVTVTFSESVNATTGSFSIECPTGSPQTFTLSASPSATFTLDPTADLPAGTTCTVKVLAAGITDADTFDPPDNMAADYAFSFGVKPLAVDDMRSATGNVKIDTATTGYSVLANDQGSGLTVTAFDATSASGGEVTMNTTTGTFTYNPPRGFTGTDSFNYTISGGGGSDTGTVVLTVTDRVWFVNNAAGACSSDCDGRLTNPYTTLAAFEADNGAGGPGDPAAGDAIFLYTGDGDYTGPLTLEDNQQLIGQGATSSLAVLAGITLAPDSVGVPSTGGANPAITSAGTGITVAQSDAIHGLSVVNTTGTGITGANFVALTVSENVIVSNTTTPGVAVSLTNGALAASFKSISAGNNDATADPANGIVLTDTTGTFAVTGGGNTSQGGDNSGGTIRNTSGDAVSLSNAAGVSLNNMNIQSPAGNGIKGTNGVSDFSFTYGKINDAGDGNTEGCANFSTVGAVNATGTFTFANSQCTQTEADGINIQNYGGTLSDVNISNNLFNDKGDTATPGSAVVIIVNSTAASSAVLTKASLDNNSIFDFRAGAGFVLQGNSDVGGTNTVTYGTANSTTDVVSVTGNLFNGGSGGINNQPDRFVTGALNGRGTAAFDVSNNGTAASPIQKIDGVGIELSNFGAGTMSANVNDNRLAVNNAVASPGIGLGCDADGDTTTTDNGTLTLVVDGNNVSQTDGVGINVIARNSLCTINTRITDNTVAAPTTTTAARAGIRVDSGSTLGDTNMCLDLRNNTTAGSSNGVTTSPGINIRKQGSVATTNDFGIEGLTPSPATGAQASTYVAGQNPGSASGSFGTGGAASLSGSNYVSCSTAPDETSFFRTEPGRRADDLAFFTSPFGDAPSAPASAAAAQAAPLLAGVTSKGERSLAGGKLELPTSKRKAGMALRHTASDSSAPLAEAPRAAAAARVVQPFSGETVTANVGTLPAGKTVHIQFQVTVNNPFTGSQPQVSNTGTVSGDNFTTTNTNTAVTPILTPPSISVKDATVAEPASGSATAAFAVTLSHSYTHTVTVDFATASGGANPATAGSDYTTTTGTLTFNPGQTVQTVSVPVLADGDASETDETFLVNLVNNSANSSIADAQAVGTIKPEGTPGTLIISELRTSGPAGADDDFVELLNNTDSPITVAAADASAGWALVKSGATCGDTPVVVAVIPNGTVIPARGNYLVTGSAYSLGAYAAGDQALVFNLENDSNVALFNTSDLSNVSTAGRLDAVGFGTNTGGNCDLLREGATLQPAAGSASEHSFVRKVDKGATADTNDNASDFVVVSTTPATPVGDNAAPTLGAPGPENSTGARGPVPCNVVSSPNFGRARLDAAAALGSAPNTVRDATVVPNGANGTIDFRRTFTNNTGGNVTELRFRITNVKGPIVPGTADLRALTSLDTVVATSGGPATVRGTTLEQPPAQPSGGSINSSLGVGSITLATPLAPGASVNLHLLFGVQQAGDYHLSMVVETATAGQIGQDVWELRGNTENGTSNEGGCNTPPVANAGADQTIECGGGLTPVSLDGSLSADADGDTLTYEWREGAAVLGTGATLNTSLSFGPHVITLKVTDPSGDFGEDTVNVTIQDTLAPSITPPPNVTVYTGPGSTSCGAFVSDETLGNATATDGCSGTVTITRSGVPAGNNFPVGTTVVTYTADDGHGHTKDAFQSVTVIDNTPPTVTAPANIEVNAPPNSCSVSLDPGTASAGDNCPGVNVAGARSDMQALNAPYPVGITTITWTATDASGNTATAFQTVKVNDATPPVITLTTGTINLGPPNHQYQTFSVSDFVAGVSDGCDASVDINDVVISQATSDEQENAAGNGDGNTVNDIVIAPDCKSLQLRAERAGGGDGRVYTITLKVKDTSGNVATAVRKVFVPRTGPAVDSGVNYAVGGCAP
ncbi:MAG TPA: Ig-like domain-containing protein [Pyrinomonadaceae bacterium]|nr:Ig-like domain-containing protein [Pyrinomonadaceae bacterium]